LRVSQKGEFQSLFKSTHLLLLERCEKGLGLGVEAPEPHRLAPNRRKRERERNAEERGGER